MQKERISLAWADKAAIVELLAFSLRYPDAELACAVASGEWAQTVAEAMGALAGGDVAGEVESLLEGAFAGKDSVQIESALRAEATRLFIGAPAAAVLPYEGAFRIAVKGGKPLLFVNRYCKDVEAFFARCGIGAAQGQVEPLDHIANELALLQYLAALAAGIAEPLGTVAADDLPGGNAEAAYGEFFGTHLASWATAFANVLDRESACVVYRAVARLLAAYVASENAVR